jgi:tRNA1(Val) A37 N6-methylase TrmN6
MRHEKLEPKRLRFVQQRPDTPPWLFLLEGRRGGKPFLQVDAPLIIEGEGGFSPELLRIYQKEHNL